MIGVENDFRLVYGDGVVARLLENLIQVEEYRVVENDEDVYSNK